MYAYLKGTLEDIEGQRVILDINGVGYEVIVSTSLIQKLPPKGKTIKLYTYYNVREDIQELYGFLKRDEKVLFEKLISVSGIGPKGAMAMLSVLTVEQLVLAIVTGDAKTLSSAPGIGKKTAQRMILELKEKIDNSMIKSGNINDNFDTNNANEVVQALIALGYQSDEAMKAFQSIQDRNHDISDLIKMSLKALDRNK